jgi:hypothetical protein
MNRCLGAVVSSFAIAVAGIGYSPTAVGEPSTGAEEPSCVYTLSQPQVVQVSGVLMVTATLTPYPCTGSINPNSMTVCITPESTPAAGKCGFSAVPDYAEVFVPYKPGTAYVTKGTGCGSVYTTQGSICSSVGPHTTTL